jgi:hypothetical protein
MKSKLLKTVLVVLTPILVVGISTTVRSERKTAEPLFTSLKNPEVVDRPNDEPGVVMIDKFGNRQTCFLESQYINPGKQIKSGYFCWSDNVSK